MPQLTVDTGMNTKPVLNGIRDMNSAIRSLRSVVSQAGKSMDAAVVGYAKAMRNNAAASREAQIQIQELERTYERLRQQLDALAETKIYSDEYKKLQDYLRGAEKSLQDLNNAAVKDAKAIQNMQRVIALLKHDMRELENEGKAFTLGSETEEFQKLQKQANDTIAAANKVRELADQKLAPLYLQQWREMTTVTGTVANGLARVANAAMSAGNALIHPFETLNRLIPLVLSGFAQLARKALDTAISFGKMAISRAATILKNIASAALNAAANLAKMAGSAVISFLRRLAEAARNAAAQIAKVAGKAVMAGLKGIGSLASKAGKSILGIGKSAKRSNNSLGQAVKMLVRYGFGVRSIYMLVRRLRGALVDAFKNMAKQVPEVNKAISSLSASLGMLKNSMATAFQPILNAIAPILTQFMDMLSEAMTRVGMFFAALVGQDYVYKATKAQFDYAKSLDKTKKSAKEAENQLASFDELNILKAPNDSSSGTGTDTNTADGGKFIKTPLESGIKEFVETLKRMFKSGEFAELGELLASKINKFIGSIDWAGYAVKIGDLVNGLVKFYNAFMEDIGWRDIGTNIADVINGLVDTIDWEALGRAFSQRINAIFGILTGLIDQINEANLGQALSDALWGFFGNIHWVEIGTTIGKGLNKIAGAVTEFATNFPWEEFATEVANGANALFSQITPTKIGGMLVGIIHGGFKFLLKFLQIFKFEEHGKALQEGIKTFVEGIDADLIGETLKSAIIGVLSYITTALGDEQTWRVAGLKLAFALNRLFGTHQAGENVWTRLADAIVTAAKSVIAALTGFVGGFDWGQAGEQFRLGVLRLVENFPTAELTHLLTISLKGIIDLIGPIVSDQKLWREAGIQFSTALNAFFGKKSLWEDAGKTVNGMLNSILTFGRSFLGGFRADDAARNIKAALAQIEWDSIATQTWGVIKLAFKKAGDFLNVLFGDDEVKTSTHRIPAGLKGVYAVTDDLAKTVSKHIETDNSSLGTKIGNRIREALSQIPWKSIGEELWTSAKAIGTNIVDFIASLFAVSDEDIKAAGGNRLIAIGAKIGETISSAFAKIDWEQFGTDVGTGADNLFAAISKCFQTIRDNGTLKNAVDTFFGAIPDDIAESAANAADNFLKKLGKALLKKLWENIKADLRDIGKLLVPELNDPNFGAGRDPESKARAYEAMGGGVLPQSVVKELYGQGNDVGEGILDSVADGYVDKSKTRKKNIEDANEDTFIVAMTDPAKQVATDAVDAAADSYVSQANARKEDVQNAAKKVFLPSPEELRQQAHVVAVGMESELKTAFSAIDGWSYGDAAIADYFQAFKGRYSENGVIKADFEMAVDEILGVGATVAFNNGQMTPEAFWVAWQNHMRDKQPETAEALNSAVADTYEGFPDAGERAGAGLANGTWSSFIQSTLDNQGDAEEAVLSTFDYLWEAVNAEGNGEMVAVDWMNSFVETVENEEGRVKPEFIAVVKRMFGSYDAYNQAKLNGKDFLYGLVNGMAGEEDETKKKLVGIIDSILKFVQHSPEGLDSNSPSKRAERYGRDFMIGFQNGTQEEQSSVSSTLLDIFSNIANSGKDGLESVDISEPFENEWSDISSSLNSNLSTMQSDLSGSMSSMEGTTQNSVQQQTQPFYDNWKAAIWIVRQSLDTMTSEISSSMYTIASTVQQGMYMVSDTMNNSMNDLAYAASHVNWWSIGDYIVAGIQDGVIDNWRWLERTVWNLAIRLYNTACNALGIHSPSKLFREGVGQMIGLGVAEGFEDTEPTIMNSVTDVADAMVDKMASTDMQFDVGAETALSTFSDKIADSFATLLDRLQTIADSVTFRTPDVAAGTVVPYNVAAKVGGDSAGLVEALEVSNDDLASVIIQATNNAAVAIVEAIQRHGGVNNPNVSAQTSAIIDEINRRTRANGVSPILM